MGNQVNIPDYPQASATLINFNCPKDVDLKELML
jgi:hypothetical protein